MLEVESLSCERDDRSLFTNLSFSLSSGEILQIEGANGAGKTTLLRIIAGLTSNYSGKITWQSQPLADILAEFRLSCFFLGHKPGLKPELSPVENLRWRLQVVNSYPQPQKIIHALGQVQLAGYEDVPCSHLSAGQLRRVALAGLLVSHSRLWILDEPFTAIDVNGVAWLEEQLLSHARKGGMALVTSHQPLKLTSDYLRRILLEHSFTERQEVMDD